MITSSHFLVTPARFADAFEMLRDEIAGVPEDRLTPINIDVEQAAVGVLGCLPDLRRLRPGIVAESPTYDMTTYDKIDVYAMAAAHAYVRHRAASVPPEDIPPLVAELTEARDQLEHDARVLARRKLLDEDRLKELRRIHGHKNLTFDALLLVAILRDSWEHIGGRTAVTLEELDRTERVVQRLARAVGFREYGTEEIAEAVITRNRAFSLFVRAYENVRRIVTFHRWHEGDGNRYAPSLYRGRGGRGKKPQKGAARPNATDGA